MSYLVCVQDFQEGFVNVWLTLETVLDLVNVVNSVVELDRLVVLERRPSGRRAAHRRVGLNRRRARRGVRWDRWIGLAGGRVSRRLNRLMGVRI